MCMTISKQKTAEVTMIATLAALESFLQTISSERMKIPGWDMIFERNILHLQQFLERFTELSEPIRILSPVTFSVIRLLLLMRL